MEELSDRILGSGFSVSPTSYQNWITNLAKVDTEILKVGSSERQYNYVRLQNDPQIIDVNINLVK